MNSCIIYLLLSINFHYYCFSEYLQIKFCLKSSLKFSNILKYFITLVFSVKDQNWSYWPNVMHLIFQNMTYWKFIYFFKIPCQFHNEITWSRGKIFMSLHNYWGLHTQRTLLSVPEHLNFFYADLPCLSFNRGASFCNV